MKYEHDDASISRKVRKFIQLAGLNPNAVAKKAGIDNANFYRLLRNERKWQFHHLERVCEALSISFRDLFGQPIHIPIVATISALNPFPYPHVIDKTASCIEYHGGAVQEEGNMELYGIEVGDRSFLPAFQAGTRFVVEKNSANKIKDESLVVCPDETGGAQICRLHIAGEEQITLRSLNPTVPDRILPKSHLKLCDRVVIIYPV